jgi:hypothetical protein
MDRHEGPHTSLTIALHADLYLVILIDRHEESHIALIITLYRGL